MSETFDVIVIGVGGFGSGAFYHLAKRGLKVLGIEQFGIAHDQGSSHGQTRIIRQAYFEHPNYVPLAIHAYDLWRELEAASGQSLITLNGVLLAGPPQGEAIAGAKLSANQHGLNLEELSPQQAATRFPEFRFAEEQAVVFEPHAGYLRVEQCVETHIREALKLGATLNTHDAVQHWSCPGNTVHVMTDRQEYEAAKLVVTAGPWSGKILKELGLPLQVLRKPVFWSGVKTEHLASLQQMPAFLFELPAGVFYGLPGTDGTSVKLAEHSGGQPVTDPNEAVRELLPEDRQRVEHFARECIPAANLDFWQHQVCFYTMTPDGHFVIDQHPNHPNVVFGAGFSGHGFKFTSILGQALAEMAIDGTTDLPVEFLRLGRFDRVPGA